MRWISVGRASDFPRQTGFVKRLLGAVHEKTLTAPCGTNKPLALFRLPLSQPDTGATAVLVDELYAG
jgi:hypothetical protein